MQQFHAVAGSGALADNASACVPDTVEIAVTTRSERSHTFRISVDGESLSLPIGSTIRLRKADFCVNVVLRAGHNFAGALRNKLMWGADVR